MLIYNYELKLSPALLNYQFSHKLRWKYELLYFSQEDFFPQRNITTQIKMVIAALEDARLTNNNIYLTYINFINDFGSIDHVRLLAWMEDLGYLKDAIELIGNIYTNSTTSFHRSHFGTTHPIDNLQGHNQRQHTKLNITHIFLYPLQRLLGKRLHNAYHFNTSGPTCNTTTYANDLSIITANIIHPTTNEQSSKIPT